MIKENVGVLLYDIDWVMADKLSDWDIKRGTCMCSCILSLIVIQENTPQFFVPNYEPVLNMGYMKWFMQVDTWHGCSIIGNGILNMFCFAIGTAIHVSKNLLAKKLKSAIM